MIKYKFKTKPYEHKIKALQQSWNKKEYAWFMEMGTGKTKVAIDNIGILNQQNYVKEDQKDNLQYHQCVNYILLL